MWRTIGVFVTGAVLVRGLASWLRRSHAGGEAPRFTPEGLFGVDGILPAPLRDPEEVRIANRITEAMFSERNVARGWWG
jgi:hypothetical protein